MEFDFNANTIDTSLKDIKPANLIISIELFGRKKKTKVEGLNHPKFGFTIETAKAHLKTLKNKLNCNGGVKKDTFEITLFGDHQDALIKYFTIGQYAIISEENITTVGISKSAA